MSMSLRDQLLQAGLANERQSKEAAVAVLVNRLTCLAPVIDGAPRRGKSFASDR
jgi:hypothetical protein